MIEEKEKKRYERPAIRAMALDEELMQAISDFDEDVDDENPIDGGETLSRENIRSFNVWDVE